MQERTLCLGGQVVTLTVDTLRCIALDRERPRDDLVAWLAGHHLHLGGEFPVLVVYSPESEPRPHSWRPQRRWLAIRFDGRHRLDLADAQGILAPELYLAAVEAIAGAQVALAEASPTCDLDLQQLASTPGPRGRSARAPAPQPGPP